MALEMQLPKHAVLNHEKQRFPVHAVYRGQLSPRSVKRLVAVLPLSPAVWKRTQQATLTMYSTGEPRKWVFCDTVLHSKYFFLSSQTKLLSGAKYHRTGLQMLERFRTRSVRHADLLNAPPPSHHTSRVYAFINDILKISLTRSFFFLKFSSTVTNYILNYSTKKKKQKTNPKNSGIDWILSSVKLTCSNHMSLSCQQIWLLYRLCKITCIVKLQIVHHCWVHCGLEKPSRGLKAVTLKQWNSANFLKKNQPWEHGSTSKSPVEKPPL